MRKRMSVGEFKDYCTNNSHEETIFTTMNQPWRNAVDTCRLDCVFTTITVSENPNAIHLHGGENYIKFRRVKFVEINDDESVLGIILRIFCENEGRSPESMPYILVMR